MDGRKATAKIQYKIQKSLLLSKTKLILSEVQYLNTDRRDIPFSEQTDHQRSTREHRRTRDYELDETV